MRSQRYEGKQMRAVLAGMVTSDKVLATIAPKWNPPGLFDMPWANMVARWCVDHFKKTGKAPGQTIGDRFARWAEHKGADKTSSKIIEGVERFLVYVSDEHGHDFHFNPNDRLELAERYFQGVQLANLVEDIEGLDSRKAFERIQTLEPFSVNGEVRPADQIEIRPVRWLWRPWIARGELTLFDGDPGVGKSQMLLDIAARVTRGWKMPPEPRGTKYPSRSPANVIILGGEDTWETTIIPRLILAQADLAQVSQVTKEAIAIPKDLPHIEAAVKSHHTKLLIVDPIMAFVSAIDGNAETQVRVPLHQLRDMAERNGVAVAMIRHFKKSKDRAIHRGGGSIAWTAACRLLNVIGKHPEEEGKYVLANAKNNLDKAPRSLGFRIEGGAVPGSKENRRIETSCVEWIGEIDVSADSVANPSEDRGRPRKVDEAVEMILDLLEEGPIEAKQLQNRVMDELEISLKTFKTAKKQAGVTSYRRGFGPAGRWWYKI